MKYTSSTGQCAYATNHPQCGTHRLDSGICGDEVEEAAQAGGREGWEIQLVQQLLLNAVQVGQADLSTTQAAVQVGAKLLNDFLCK